MVNVLIVEDDLMIADNLEAFLVDAGYEVCGIAETVAEGVRLGRQCRPDLGVIDVHLSDGENGTEVAAALSPQVVFGVLYVTGNPDHILLEHAIGEACLTKPYSSAALLAALRYVSQRMDNVAVLALPDRLKVLKGHCPSA